jgi:hypothetical protein
MKIARRDWIFIAVTIVILGALFIGKGRLKSGSVPYDEKHARIYEDMNKGEDRAVIEKNCHACHGPQSVPLSKGHPPKEQCLICHKLVQLKK